MCYYHAGNHPLPRSCLFANERRLQALRRRLSWHPRLGPAAGVVACLVRSVPLRGTLRLEDPFHISRLSPYVLRFRILAREPGDNRSRLPPAAAKIPFDANEHTVTLVVLSEPKLDQLRSIQRFVALVSCIDNRPVCFQVSAECSGEPFSYGDRIIAQGKFSVPTRPMNPGEFDFGAYLQRQNIYLNFRTHRDVPAMVTAQNQGNRLRCVRARCPPPDPAGFASWTGR